MPYFDDEFMASDLKAARNADGEVYNVPADMTYEKWQETFVDGGDKDGLNKYGLTLGSEEVTIGYSDGYTVLDDIQNMSTGSEQEVKQKIDDFCTDFAYAPEEHALVITKGKTYSMTGSTGSVNPIIIGENLLQDAIVVHNHPVSVGEKMADSFSIDDLLFSARLQTGMSYLVSGQRKNVFEFTKSYTEDEIINAWSEARLQMWEKSLNGELEIIFEQEEIMKILPTILKGLEFYENL